MHIACLSVSASGSSAPWLAKCSVFYPSFFSSSNPYSFLRIIRDVKSFASGVLTFTVGPNAKINEHPVRGWGGLGGWGGREEWKLEDAV